MSDVKLVVCHECDLICHEVSLHVGEAACCPRCHARLFHRNRSTLDQNAGARLHNGDSVFYHEHVSVDVAAFTTKYPRNQSLWCSAGDVGPGNACLMLTGRSHYHRRASLTDWYRNLYSGLHQMGNTHPNHQPADDDSTKIASLEHG